MAKKPGISLRGTTYERVKAHTLSLGVGNPDWVDALINADLDARGWPAAGMPPPIDFKDRPRRPVVERPKVPRSRAKKPKVELAEVVAPKPEVEPAVAEQPPAPKMQPRVSKGEPVAIAKNGSGENPPDGAGYCTF